MILTREFLHQHQTANGGFTRAQIEALGFTFPPKGGWLRSMVGKDVPQSVVDAFVAGAKVFKKTHKTDTPAGLFGD